MSFKTQLLKIMQHPNWVKGRCVSIDLFRKAIIKYLGFTDARTIAKWIGREKKSWVKRYGYYGQSANELRTEWKEGLLEEFDIIEMLSDAEAKQLLDDMYIREFSPYFKILKDKTDFENTT
jgi:hypothetical protein